MYKYPIVVGNVQKQNKMMSIFTLMNNAECNLTNNNDPEKFS